MDLKQYTAAVEAMLFAHAEPLTSQRLVDKGLIEEAGRMALPGRPVSFRTTDVFLRCFGLSSLTDLPPLHGEGPRPLLAEEPAPAGGAL